MATLRLRHGSNGFGAAPLLMERNGEDIAGGLQRRCVPWHMRLRAFLGVGIYLHSVLGCGDVQMTTAQRIQLKRTKAWKMPSDTVKVDRATPYGNPFTRDFVAGFFPELTNKQVRQKSVDLFREWITGTIEKGWCDRKPPSLETLRGKSLACWCHPGEPCHADVLLEIANAQSDRTAAKSEGGAG